MTAPPHKASLSPHSAVLLSSYCELKHELLTQQVSVTQTHTVCTLPYTLKYNKHSKPVGRRMLMYTETWHTHTNAQICAQLIRWGKKNSGAGWLHQPTSTFMCSIFCVWVSVCPTYGSGFSGLLRHFPILFQHSVSRLWLTALHVCICSSHIPSPLLLSLLQPHPFLSPHSALSLTVHFHPLLPLVWHPLRPSCSLSSYQMFWALLSLPMSWYLPLCKALFTLMLVLVSVPQTWRQEGREDCHGKINEKISTIMFSVYCVIMLKEKNKSWGPTQSPWSLLGII